MSEVFEAIILGVVQGLTEFLPVSSSGHLEILKYIFGYDGTGKESLTLTVMLHGATALSTVVIFWKDIIHILKDILKFEWNTGTKFACFIIASMIPAAVIGLFFEEELEVLFEGKILFVGAMLVVTGGLLILAEKLGSGDQKLNYKNSLLVGLAQAIAILPGVSRSGATISTSLVLGLDKSQAARFSFLMVLPLIFGKIAKDLIGGEVSFSQAEMVPLVAGSIAAFTVGMLACKWMIAIVRRSQLSYFAIYCFTLAAIVYLAYFLI